MFRILCRKLSARAREGRSTPTRGPRRAAGLAGGTGLPRPNRTNRAVPGASHALLMRHRSAHNRGRRSRTRHAITQPSTARGRDVQFSSGLAAASSFVFARQTGLRKSLTRPPQRDTVSFPQSRAFAYEELRIAHGTWDYCRASRESANPTLIERETSIPEA